MKIESGFYNLAVGNTVTSEFDEGVVVQVLNAGEIVTICWIRAREIEDYNEDAYTAGEFTAYSLV